MLPGIGRFVRIERVAIASALALAAVADADTVTLRLPDSTVTEQFSNAKVSSIENGAITFSTSDGRTLTKKMDLVADLSLDDEPAFDQAMRDFQANRLDRAADEFEQTIQKTDKPWLRTFCAPRLADAANRTGRFDEAVEAYILIIQSDPAEAAKYRPSVPGPGSDALDPAAASLQSAADAPGLMPEQEQALLALLLEVQRARHDEQAVDAVASRLARSGLNPSNPLASVASAALADGRLAAARAALKQKNFPSAMQIIDDARHLFLDPGRQSEALFIVAQAKEGMADASGDASAYKDAALAYLRVAADFKSASGAPHVAESLLRAGAILQKLNEPGEALAVYQRIVADYPDSQGAAEAQDQISRLAPGAAAQQ